MKNKYHVDSDQFELMKLLVDLRKHRNYLLFEKIDVPSFEHLFYHFL